jgi:hypothetical protein
MGPPWYMRSVINRNVVIRLIPVYLHTLRHENSTAFVPNADTIKYATRGTKLVTFVLSLIKSLTNYIDVVNGVTRNL